MQGSIHTLPRIEGKDNRFAAHWIVGVLEG